MLEDDDDEDIILVVLQCVDELDDEQIELNDEHMVVIVDEIDERKIHDDEITGSFVIW